MTTSPQDDHELPQTGRAVSLDHIERTSRSAKSANSKGHTLFVTPYLAPNRPGVQAMIAPAHTFRMPLGIVE